MELEVCSKEFRFYLRCGLIPEPLQGREMLSPPRMQEGGSQHGVKENLSRHPVSKSTETGEAGKNRKRWRCL